MVMIGQGWSADWLRDVEAAATAARMAAERDPNDALALAFHGHGHSFLLKEYEVARQLLDRALAAGPSCAWAWSGLTHAYLGNHPLAILHTERTGQARSNPATTHIGTSVSCRLHIISRNATKMLLRGAACRRHMPVGIPLTCAFGRRAEISEAQRHDPEADQRQSQAPAL